MLFTAFQVEFCCQETVEEGSLDQAVKSKGGRLLIKFTQRDGYGSSIEFIERRGSDGADVDEKNNGFWAGLQEQ